MYANMSTHSPGFRAIVLMSINDKGKAEDSSTSAFLRVMLVFLLHTKTCGRVRLKTHFLGEANE